MQEATKLATDICRGLTLDVPAFASLLIELVIASFRPSAPSTPKGDAEDKTSAEKERSASVPLEVTEKSAAATKPPVKWTKQQLRFHS